MLLANGLLRVVIRDTGYINSFLVFSRFVQVQHRRQTTIVDILETFKLEALEIYSRILN